MSDPAGIPDEQRLGEWLQAQGPDHDIALCTRVRFARNVRGYRFSTTIDAAEARELIAYLTERLTSLEDVVALQVTDLSQVGDLDREMLVERHLISRELAQSGAPRAVAVDSTESVSLMINEEDHLRSQVFRSGFRVEETFAAAERFDDALLAAVPVAFSEEFGFLTTCPTNVGTGLRLSVMLHLPGMVWGDEMKRATNAAKKLSLAVRGLYGEGSGAHGDFYQVSNHVTLGESEEHIRRDVERAVQSIVRWEREVREALLTPGKRAKTVDRVFRALGTLQSARVLSSEECLEALSAVRFGVETGIVPDLSIHTLNRILLAIQPGHLQRLAGTTLDPQQRDARRAEWVRRALRDARAVDEP